MDPNKGASLPPPTAVTPSSSQKAVPVRRRLQPSDKQLKQQHHSSHPTRQKSFSSTSQTIMAGLYDLEETLGKGHFATVKAAKHVFTGERVAVKVIDKTKLDGVSQKALLKEVLCMKLVQHPNVVKLYEVIDTSSKMYLVLELGQGDLYDLILRQQGGLPERDARIYFNQILTAVSYCHKLHVAHRDLKPENVVFFPPNPQKQKTLGQVKLTDFGFSNKFCPGVNLDTSCGSLAYSAPEILLGDSYDAPLVDIWSLGVILYMLVCGRAPFQEANDSETLTMIMDVKYSIPDHLSSNLKDLITRMLVRDPNRRINLDDIQAHDWVNEGGVNEREATATSLPLIASNTLTDAESERICNEMVKGGVVSSVEEVKSSLRSSAYDHLTSTYYLLAERYLREKTRRIRTPTVEQSTTPTSPTGTSHPPTPTPSDVGLLTPTPSSSPPTSPPIRIRKNSHQFEDVILPSAQSETHVKAPAAAKQPTNIAGLDLETTNQRKKFACLPVIDGEEDTEPQPYYSSRNNSPHHQHYYHHLPPGRRSQTPKLTSPDDPSSSPPKYCSSRAPRMSVHHSHSDSSDEGGTPGASGGGATAHPTINIVLTENSEPQSNDSPDSSESSNTRGNQHLVVNNNVLLKASNSYEGIADAEDDDGSGGKRKTKKKRILFLSWFFKRSGGGKVNGGDKSSSKNRNIYKTKSCSELKSRNLNVEMDVRTRECFGVCNGDQRK